MLMNYYNFFKLNFNFNFVLPNVNTDYIRQAQVLNIDNLRLIIYLWKFNENKYTVWSPVPDFP